LIARLEQSQNALRHWRQIWQQVAPDERVRYTEVNDLFQTVQDLVVRILMLDRENQQSLLRRGLLPPQGLPSFAGQKPNFVSSLYRRHAVS
jgi:hypothetical protein